MTEVASTSYYSDMDDSFIDSLNLCKQACELYFASVLFGSDLSRVIYATPSISLRRRTELENDKVEKDGQIYVQDLNLPYGSLFIKPQVSDDDRGGAVSAAHILVGVEEGDVKTRAQAIKYSGTINLFYSSFEDVRKAQAILWQEARPKGPAWLSMWLAWNGHRIGIPCNVTIDAISTDDYDETNWLAKARVFRIQVDVTIRTYNVYMPEARGVSLPVRFVYFRETLEQMKYPLTLDVSLEWSTKKFATELAELDSKYFDDYYHHIDGYLDTDEDISIGIEPIVALDSITYKISANKDSISYVIITVNNKTVKIEASSLELQEDGSYATEVVFDSLSQNSSYKAVVTAFSTKGTAKTYTVNNTTLADETDETPTAERINATEQNLTEYNYDNKSNDYSDLEGLTL